ncbi:MAG: HEAT repeat domain-containing protein [Myxococcota bacterium]
MARPSADVALLQGLPSADPIDALEQLDALRERLSSLDDPEQLRALAQALPTNLAALSPEVAMAVHAVASALVEHQPTLPTDLAALDPWMRIQWLRVAIAAGSPVAEPLLDEPTWHQVMVAWSLDTVLDPRGAIEALCHAEDPALRRRGLEQLRPAVESLASSTSEAATHLIALAEDEDHELRGIAVGMLAEGWLGEPSPTVARAREAALQRALVDAELPVALAAVRTLAAEDSASHRELLWERLLEPDAPLAVRVEVLERLGPRARDEDLEFVLEIANEEPLAFGPGARTFLLEAHRHGVFLRAHHLEALLAQFDAHRAWTGEELCRVTHIVRHELVEVLGALPADDERWTRRATILAVSVSPAAPALIARILQTTNAPAVALALLDAAGRCPDYDDEPTLLKWLPTLPDAVVPVARVKGGAATESALMALVEDPLTPPRLRTRILPALWALTRERPTLPQRLSTALGPHDSGLLGRTFLQRRDATVAQLVAEPPWESSDAHRLDRLKRLELLIESGDDRFADRIEALFREQFREYVGKALAGDFSIKRLAMPELEQMIFRYGRYLVADGRHVRPFIDDTPETGRDLVLRMVCGWLAEEPTPPIMVALLETLGRHDPSSTVLRTIIPLWRHGHREVRRAAIETILAAGERARGLELSLCRLVQSDEPRIVTQALAAVASLNAQWAEPMVLAALSHPQMIVKKEAAQALSRIASARAVPTLVGWLAHHDNPGLRQGLVGALVRAAGPSLVAVIVGAIERQTEARRIGLLCQVLEGRLPMAAALRLARSSQPIHADLLERCLTGRLRLADGDPTTLARRLHRASLRPTPPERDEPGQRLRIEGFSAEAARQLVEERNDDNEAEIREVVRAGLADWITWLKHEDPVPADAFAVVLDAADPVSIEHGDALLDLLERAMAPSSGAAAKFIEHHLALGSVAAHRRLRSARVLRALEPSPDFGGRRRWELLGRLGAIRGGEDLWQCLEHCRVRPAASDEIAALLRRTLQIPAEREREATALTELREQSLEFHTWTSERRRSWLAATLESRPLHLPPNDELEPTPPRRPTLPSADRQRELLAMLDSDVSAERDRAAAQLLNWPDATDARPRIFDAYLRGRITLSSPHRTELAPSLAAWPADKGARERAAALVAHVPPHRLRTLVSAWIEAWDAGDADVEPLLRRYGQDLLPPLARRRARHGDPRLLGLLHSSAALPTRALIEEFEERYPDEVARLRTQPSPEELTTDEGDPDDPLAGRDLDGLVALIGEKGVAKGLAVRAVHALTEYGERAIARLDPLVTDRRPPVRSAALRALRKVAPREVTLPATARALAMESRKDVIGQLMKSLGHGKYEPALVTMLEYLEHRELAIRNTAHEAIVAYGPDIVPTLRRLGRRARPDRRRTIEALATELETGPGSET